MKSLLSACSLAFLVLVPELVLAEEKPDPKPAAPAEKPAATGEKSNAEDSGAEGFDIPVPIGERIKGIKIPHYGPDGKLLMMFDAETALKTDEQHIELDMLRIDAYSDDGKKIYIELPRSVFNLETRILTGENRVLIRREDFEITGNSGEFHTKNRFAKIIGNVKMTIYSTENFENP